MLRLASLKRSNNNLYSDLSYDLSDPLRLLSGGAKDLRFTVMIHGERNLKSIIKSDPEGLHADADHLIVGVVIVINDHNTIQAPCIGIRHGQGMHPWIQF